MKRGHRQDSHPAAPVFWLCRGLRREHAAAYIDISPRTFDAWVDAGLMPQPRRIGGVVLWDRHQLDAALDDIFNPAGEAASNPWD